MFMLIVQSLLLIALAYLIGCLLGCLAKQFLGASKEPRYVAHEPEKAPGAVAPAADMPVEAGNSNKNAAMTKNKAAAPASKAEMATPKEAPLDTVSAAAIKQASVALVLSPAQKEAAEKADAAGSRPNVLARPLGAGKDNLKRIKGVGPKNEQALNGLGLFHFAQIAALTAKEAAWVGSFLAFPGRIEREEWVAQAKALAAGEETEFSKRVDKGAVDSSK